MTTERATLSQMADLLACARQVVIEAVYTLVF